MIYTAIAICEVAFWALLAGGLSARYVFQQRRLSTGLLMASPAADVLLLLLVAFDLEGGAEPTQAHALAATYLGFSLVFGPSIVRWADSRLAGRFTTERRLVSPQQAPAPRLEQEWRLFYQAAQAWIIAVTLLLGLSALVGDVERAQPLLQYIAVLSIVLGIWFLAGPLREYLDPLISRQARATASRALASVPMPNLTSRQGGTVMQQNSNEADAAGRWAPWWAYAGLILGANYLRQVILPHGSLPEWGVVLLVLAMSGALFLAITATYRLAGALGSVVGGSEGREGSQVREPR
jgi:hypothetical protein